VEDENAVAFKGAEPVDTLTVTPAVTTNYDMLADGVSRRMTVTVTIPPPVEDREMTINGVTYRTIAVTP
jgi:hypothetical protein